MTNAGVPAAQPSRFWARLGAEHERSLAEFGFDQVKRHQALRYFTWRWTWSGLPRSEQFRFLLTHTSPATWARCSRAPMDLSDEAWAGVPWDRADRWLYCFATRLLWEYARGRDTEGILTLPEPQLGSPLPVTWGGRLISQDLANSALEVAAIARALSGRTPRTILEVGGGYGRSAYALMNRFPRARYTIVDIPPSRQIGEWYLSQLFSADRFRCLAPEDLQSDTERFDLVLTISSLQEMTPDQVRWYLSLFDEVAPGRTVYLKQWASWRNPEDGVTLTFDEYPVPAPWVQVFRQRAPVQSRFVEAAWHVPGSPDGST